MSMDRPRRQPRVAYLLKELQPASANLFLPALQTAPQLEWSRPNNKSRNNNQSPPSLFALEEEYAKLMQAEATFPSDIDDNNVYSSVLQYQSHMDSVIESLNCVCGCCGHFASKKESQISAINDCLIYNFITLELLVISNIDSCGISDNSICVCLIYRKSLSLGNRPKFGILNGLLCADCQSYPPTLVDFFMAEEAAIVCMHLIVFILKLRPSGIFNLIAYSGIKEHAVFSPQNQALLLTLFLFPTLVLYDVIHIVWAG